MTKKSRATMHEFFMSISDSEVERWRDLIWANKTKPKKIVEEPIKPITKALNRPRTDYADALRDLFNPARGW